MSALERLAHTEISALTVRHLRVFEPEDLVSRVLGELEEMGRYEAVVSSGDRYGLITIRDLLDVEQPEQTKLGDYSDGIWRVVSPVSPGDLVIDVAHILFESNIRAVPVAENGELMGVVSQVEISNALCDIRELRATPAKELIRRPVITLEVDEKVTKARRLMLDNGFSHIPVTRSGRLVGLVTARDIVHTFLIPSSKSTYGDWGEQKVTRFPGPVSAVMDEHPFTVEPKASALDVACGLRRMEKSACIMVDAEGSILGIMTPRELISLLLRPTMEEALPVYIMGLAEEGFFERAVAEDKVRRVVTRSLRFHPRINEVSIKIKRQQTSGNRVRYQVTARAMGPAEHFNVTAEGWDLLETFDKLCENLDSKLRRGKPQPEASPRRPRRGRR
ncbi:MAG: CBS domain-containing protein [Candidatus Bathyarchaeia archaeon]